MKSKKRNLDRLTNLGNGGPQINARLTRPVAEAFGRYVARLKKPKSVVLREIVEDKLRVAGELDERTTRP